eukprot:205783-Alexandrium_andersonii.AAC.1
MAFRASRALAPLGFSIPAPAPTRRLRPTRTNYWGRKPGRSAPTWLGSSRPPCLSRWLMDVQL